MYKFVYKELTSRAGVKWCHVICSVIFLFAFVFCLNSVELIIIYSKATLNLFINSYLFIYLFIYLFGLFVIGPLGERDKTKIATRRHTRFGCLSTSVYVVSLCTKMQTLRVFAINENTQEMTQSRSTSLPRHQKNER